MTDRETTDMAAKAIANEIYSRIRGTVTPDDNPYEFACNRFGVASNAYELTKKIADYMVLLANDEYDAAGENLSNYERVPGICKPEYRNWGYDIPAN